MGRKRTELSDEEKAAICTMYAAGEPIADIAAAYGLSDGVVSVVAHTGGVAKRQVRSVVALIDRSMDLAKLTIEDIDGEPRVVDTALGTALGYERPRAIRQLIERFAAQLAGLGPSPHRVAMVDIGSGARRETVEHLLNLAQINYLITRCGLPRANEWCVQIAKVFTAWQTGSLEAVDLDTAVDLQDAAEAAAEAVPDLAGLTEILVRQLIHDGTSHLATKDDVNRVHLTVQTMVRRQQLKQETKIQHVDTVLSHYNGKCPCCSEVAVAGKDRSINGHFDHWTDCPSKSGAHETWLVCAACNTGFQSRRLDRQEFRSEFDVFQKRRRQTVGSRQSSFDIDELIKKSARQNY